MHIRHILFDLDGTLLPMNQDEFVTFYMPLLAKKYISEGISFDPKAFITITQINEVRGRGFTMEKLRYDELNHTKN